MKNGLWIFLLAAIGSAAIIENVCLSLEGSSTCTADLVTTQPQSISILAIQSNADISAKFCPPKADVLYTIKYLITGMNNEEVLFQRTLTSTSTACITLHSSKFSDGTSAWHMVQGVYCIIISVHDYSRYAIYSGAFFINIIRPSSLSLFCKDTIQEGSKISLSTLKSTPIKLSLPSTITPTTVRWSFDSDYSFASTSSTHQILGSSSSILTPGSHILRAFIYTNTYGHPEYSLSLTLTLTQDEDIKPTEPPRVAPTVAPIPPVSSKYCGDGICERNESCEACPNDCGLCFPYSCSSTYCSLDKCQCITTSNPTKAPISDIPQFVTLSWDDAQTPTTFDLMMKVSRNSKSRDHFGCKPKMTFFTQTNDNQYQYTKQAYLEGHEIALHSINHNTDSSSSKEVWEKEIQKGREYLSKYCGIDEKEIVGFRAPDLKYNDRMFDVLIERGFLYDSSIAVDVKSKEIVFPYTMDHGAIEQGWREKIVKKSHKGLWEIPLHTLVDDAYQVVTIQDPSGTNEQILTLLKQNFDLHYTGSRSPFLIPLSASWLLQSETDRVQVIEELLMYVTSKTNVVFASMKDIMRYVKQPVTMKNMKNSDYQCVKSIVTPINQLCQGQEINTCYYSTRNFQTCVLCPDYYPGKEPGSSTIPLPDNDKEWEGLLSYSDEVKWEGGFCMTTVIENTTAKPAKSFTLTLTTKNCQLTTLWGLKIVSSTQGKVILIADRETIIRQGQKHTGAGLCGKSSASYSIKGNVVLKSEV